MTVLVGPANSCKTANWTRSQQMKRTLPECKLQTETSAIKQIAFECESEAKVPPLQSGYSAKKKCNAL